MCTTRLRFFAECRLHLAKACLHSAKALPYTRQEHSAKPLTAKGSLPSATSRALGKGVAESQPHLANLLRGAVSDGAFAECQLSALGKN